MHGGSSLFPLNPVHYSSIAHSRVCDNSLLYTYHKHDLTHDHCWSNHVMFEARQWCHPTVLLNSCWHLPIPPDLDCYRCPTWLSTPTPSQYSPRESSIGPRSTTADRLSFYPIIYVDSHHLSTIQHTQSPHISHHRHCDFWVSIPPYLSSTLGVHSLLRTTG